MKVAVVYKSIHMGNTEKIARKIGESIDGDVFSVEEIDASILTDYDLIGFGSGIYFGKHHRSLFEFLDNIDTLEKKTFIFSTRSITPMSIAHRTLRKKLKSKGAEVVSEFSCKGENRIGPFKIVGGICRGKPDDNDMEGAAAFARKIVERI